MYVSFFNLEIMKVSFGCIHVPSNTFQIHVRLSSYCMTAICGSNYQMRDYLFVG